MPIMKRKDVGFTLLELMLVIGIIGVMSVVAVPFFNEYRAGARDSMAHADAKSFITVMTAAQK